MEKKNNNNSNSWGKVVNINWQALLLDGVPLLLGERKTDGKMNDRRYRMKQGSLSIEVEIVSSGG